MGGGEGVGGKRERVAGQETSSADEVIGLKIKRWRHLKPIPVNELSGARGKGGDRRGQGGGRRAGPRAARPPIPRPPEPPRARGGSGHVPPPSSAAPKQVPLAPLGGAGRPEEAAARPPPDAPARPPPPSSPEPRPPGSAPWPRALRAAPQQVFFKGFPLPARRPRTQRLFLLLGLFPAASPA